MSFDDCFLHDQDRLRHGDALALLEERLSPIVGSQTVACGRALKRILSANIKAPHDVPLHTNAAVDGYAYAAPATAPLPVYQRIAAGDLSPPPLQTDHAARIFTGAIMPEGADTVAMQEDCTLHNGKVSLPPLKQGANCRKRGEDVAAGDLVLQTGHRLRAQDLAALASIGAETAEVYNELNITILSNGNELRVPNGNIPLQPGEVYDANTPLLTGLLANIPAHVHCPSILPDEGGAIKTALAHAAATSDVIITTAGASRGDEDYMRAALEELGRCHMWQLAVKPGRPMMFGQIPRNDGPDAFFFGLPGNPVAAMVCFLLYVRPALLRLAGAEWHTPQRFHVPCGFSIAKKKPDRREFLRGFMRDGRAHRFPRDGSGLISSLVASDGLIEIPEDITTLNEGEPIAFIPYSAFE